MHKAKETPRKKIIVKFQKIETDTELMLKMLLFFVILNSGMLYAESPEAEALPVCSMYHLRQVKKEIEQHGQFDKFKHCGVSCLLSLRCPALDVMEIGILKELADMMGPGDAEFDDLKANFDGVELVLKKKVTSDKDCIKSCQKLYPCP